MARKSTQNPTKRVAIAIELDFDYPWHQECCQGIMRYGYEHGWSCTVDPYLLGVNDAEGGVAYDGVVGRIHIQTQQLAKAHRIPVVNHWAQSPAQNVPSVLSDKTASASMVAEHLMDAGYQRFAYIGIRGVEFSEQELEGMTQAVSAKGYQPPQVYWCLNNFERTIDAMQDFRTELPRWLAGLQTPVGVFVSKAATARYLAQFCKQMGLDVPQDVGIVVAHGIRTSRSISPSFSELDHDFNEQGYQAAALLDDLMCDRPAHPLQRLVRPRSVLINESTDVFLCDDSLVKRAAQYIAEHARQALQTEDVAKAVGASERNLRRRFEQAIGRTVRDEIARQRIARLKPIIAETRKPMAQIASEFGFSSSTQLSRYFSNAVGVTPSQYRKEQQGVATSQP